MNLEPKEYYTSNSFECPLKKPNFKETESFYDEVDDDDEENLQEETETTEESEGDEVESHKDGILPLGMVCYDVPKLSLKTFGKFKVCTLPYSRTWKKEESFFSSFHKLPNWLGRERRRSEKYIETKECPRALEDYERKLLTTICKRPSRRHTDLSREPVSFTVCVFCLESLYKNGFLYDLCEKVPLIKKQSEIYGDDVAWRIGFRTRVTVHKKCYNSYVDVLARKRENTVDAEHEKVESSSDSISDQQEDEREIANRKDEIDKRKTGIEKDETPLQKQHFCLRKPKPPEIDPGK